MHQHHSKWRKPKQRVTGGRKSTLRKAREAKVKADKHTGKSLRPRKISVEEQVKKTNVAGGRTAQKFHDFRDLSVNTSDEEFVLVHSLALGELVKNFPCCECRKKDLKTVLRDRKGSALKIVVLCSSCNAIQSTVDSSPRLQSSESSRAPFEINKRMVSTFANHGLGHTMMMRVGAGLGVKVVDLSSYTILFKNICKETEVLRKELLDKSRAVVRKTYEENNPLIIDQEIIDVSVSLDGSWHRRGHTSLYGFVGVVEVVTGLVIDFIVLSKFCHECTSAAAALGEDSADYQIWHEGHESSGQCSINYKGSSGSMEVEGAVRLWQRSVEEAKMRYTTFISDGDTKSFTELNNVKPYGPGISIIKEECTNHVSKRMGTGLRTLVQDNKKSGAALGGRGEGNLTDNAIKALQGYFHSAIKENIPSVPKMRNAILATLHHCASTDSKPQHSKCPKGKNSWCFYNKRKAKREKDLGSHAKMPIRLNQKVFKALLPLYQRLSSTELLQRCARGSTSNANESLHSVIWNKCPKHSFVSRQRVEMSITQGVGEFNMGVENLLSLQSKVSGLQVPHVAKNVAVRIDSKRKAKNDTLSTQEAKRARVLLKKAKTMKRQADRKKGGDKYTPGGGD